ncbi:hypothetical protein V496_07477 [Pseudogymnoascus sp. VKM F-4515 (FW-2607)]|nr:hypothetical protein V496_07477 [Pseudogymnoascus sp. VKM F-4515 (FW-2607)]
MRRTNERYHGREQRATHDKDILKQYSGNVEARDKRSERGLCRTDETPRTYFLLFPFKIASLNPALLSESSMAILPPPSTRTFSVPSINRSPQLSARQPGSSGSWLLCWVLDITTGADLPFHFPFPSPSLARVPFARRVRTEKSKHTPITPNDNVTDGQAYPRTCHTTGPAYPGHRPRINARPASSDQLTL